MHENHLLADLAHADAGALRLYDRTDVGGEGRELGSGRMELRAPARRLAAAHGSCTFLDLRGVTHSLLGA